MEKIRLNNFILWCKGWYQPIKTDMDFVAQAQKALVLDGYLPCNNPISIALIFIDELVAKVLTEPIRLSVWNEEIVKYMSMYNVNYNEALLYRIRNFFAFECDKLPLIPPIYSRKLYKLGFVAPSYFGNSYKMQNYKVNKVWKRK